jgi:hypothetical protein
LNSVLIKSLFQNKKYVLLSSLLVMIFVTALESTILLSVNGESQAKSDSPVDINAIDGDNNSTQNSDVPIAKMVYNSKSYEMSPFVVVENEDLKRLNFPQLPDDSEPMDRYHQTKIFL